MEIEFGACTEADVDLVIQIGKETYLNAFSEMNNADNMDDYLTKAFNREKIATEIKNPNSQFLLLFYNTKLAGYLKINENEAQSEFRNDLGLELERIYIKKNYQGEGLGKVLINKAIEIALEKSKEFV